MISPNAPSRTWVIAISKLRERLEESVQWYPFPAMIGFILVMILGGHLLTDLNPRLGARVDVLPLDSQNHPDASIWLGIYESQGKIHVVTADRRKFSWQQDAVKPQDFKKLIHYLQEKTIKEKKSTALKMESNMIRSTAIIAVDQRLRFSHMKPIIYALAEANISRYGFETRIIH